MKAINVAALQSDLHWQSPEANRSHFAAQISRLDHVDLIVLPEMFTTGFSMASKDIAEPNDGPTVSWMKTQANATGAAITGSVAVNDGGHYYNRMYWVEPNGRVTHYDKRHLFRMANEHHHYSPGSQRVIVPWQGLRFCLQVCYDLRFPVFSRNRSDYDVLIYVANWPAARAHAWKSLLPARAIENQCFVIGVNRIGQDGNGHDYSGNSVILDYMGKTLESAPENVSKTLSSSLDISALNEFKENFPAELDADGFALSVTR